MGRVKSALLLTHRNPSISSNTFLLKQPWNPILIKSNKQPVSREAINPSCIPAQSSQSSCQQEASCQFQPRSPAESPSPTPQAPPPSPPPAPSPHSAQISTAAPSPKPQVSVTPTSSTNATSTSISTPAINRAAARKPPSPPAPHGAINWARRSTTASQLKSALRAEKWRSRSCSLVIRMVGVWSISMLVRSTGIPLVTMGIRSVIAPACTSIAHRLVRVARSRIIRVRMEMFLRLLRRMISAWRCALLAEKFDRARRVNMFQRVRFKYLEDLLKSCQYRLGKGGKSSREETLFTFLALFVFFFFFFFFFFFLYVESVHATHAAPPI